MGASLLALAKSIYYWWVKVFSNPQKGVTLYLKFLLQFRSYCNSLKITVYKGQLDPVLSFKDEHKCEQDFKTNYNMYGYWNAVSKGYA